MIATQILGDMGADVIKIEAPSGDITRQLGLARHPGMSSVYLNANRNKRSLVLNLKQASARAALLKLSAGADVFVHSMRPQAIAGLGLAYEDLRAVRPDIVYCGAYGFGEAGPYGEKPAYDDIIQAAAGLAALQGGVTGTPSYVRSVVADKTVALTVAYSIAMALFHHERTGEGQEIEVPMFETMTAFLVVEHLYGLTFEPPMGDFGYPRVLASERRPFATRDGYLAVLPYNDRQWIALFEVAGRPDLAADALKNCERMSGLRDRIAAELTAAAPEARVLGDAAPRLANTTCITMPGVAAETQVMALDLAGVAVSSGAACSSGKVGPSHVLAAMAVEPAVAACAVRISLGWDSTEADADRLIEAWTALYRRTGRNDLRRRSSTG